MPNAIRIEIVRPADSGPVRVDLLTRSLRNLDFLLESMDWDAADRLLSYWHVMQLSIGDVIAVVLEPRLCEETWQEGDQERVRDVLLLLSEQLQALGDGASRAVSIPVPQCRTLHSVLEDFDELGACSLEILGATTEVTAQMLQRLDQAGMGTFTETAEVTGMVTGLHLHSKSKSLWLQPDFGDGELYCRLPEALVSAAHSAYGKRCIIRGLFYGWSRDVTYFKVDPVREIVILD